MATGNRFSGQFTHQLPQLFFVRRIACREHAGDGKRRDTFILFQYGGGCRLDIQQGQGVPGRIVPTRQRRNQITIKNVIQPAFLNLQLVITRQQDPDWRTPVLRLLSWLTTWSITPPD